MFVFGHLGLGTKLVSPVAGRLPKRWLLLGTLLPDLIDKPLYYGLTLITGLRGADLGLISGTRTVGHTVLLLFALAIAAYFRRSALFGALALGMATHLALDSVFDSLRGIDVRESIVPAILFPFTGWNFPVLKLKDAGEHLRTLFHPVILGGEIAGAFLLLWDYWKSTHRQEVFHAWRVRRGLRRERRKGWPRWRP